MYISVIIPTYQDEVDVDRIGDMFTDMGHNVQIILSEDTNPHVGKGHAIRDAIPHIVHPYTLIMDADIQIEPKEINNFSRLMELYNADAVVGNKYHPYSNIHYSFIRRIVSNCYHMLIKLLFNLPYRDTQCGFKLFNSEVLKKVLPLLKEDRYTLDLEVLVALRENNFRVVESPVYVKQQKNKGSVNFWNIYNTLIDTLHVWGRYVQHYYRLQD